eukprot:1767674-Prymnesium_polylepis.1
MGRRLDTDWREKWTERRRQVLVSKGRYETDGEGQGACIHAGRQTPCPTSNTHRPPIDLPGRRYASTRAADNEYCGRDVPGALDRERLLCSRRARRRWPDPLRGPRPKDAAASATRCSDIGP